MPNDWLSLALEAGTKLFGLGEQVAENQGLKIPMKEDAIVAHTKRRASRINDNQEIRRWCNDFEIYKEYFKPLQEKKIKDRIANIVLSPVKDMVRIVRGTKKGRNYIYIYYVDLAEKCETWIEMPGVRVKP